MRHNDANSSINTANKPPQKGSQDTPNVVAYLGTVVNIKPLTFQVDVSIDGGKSCMTAIWVSALLSSLTGLTVKSFPQIGQQVLVLKSINLNTGEVLCMGYLAQADNTSDWMVTDNFLGMDEDVSFPGTTDAMREIRDGTDKNTGHYPKDLVDGEASIDVAHGTAVDLLQNLAKLRASDLAKIEAYTIDDFIRVISQNFEHLSAFGDYKILNNNGALDVIWRGTCNEHESFDKEQEGQDKGIEVKNESITLDKFTDENIKADARWRFQQYIGKLGNFIHTFITEPQKMVNIEENEPISARSKVYNGVDGTYLVQSVSDIVFEKVIRIPTPTLKTIPEELKMAEMELDAFQQWSYNEEALYETSYQFIDYGKWLANYFSLAAFHGLTDQIDVPSESECKAPTFNVGDKNLQSPFSPIQPTMNAENFLKQYATIRIFKDGSVLLVNSDGCAVHMAGKDLTFSSPRDINIKAAGSVNITGNDITMTARKSIDIVSALRGISMKAQTWFEMACEKGSILLQSFMPEELDIDSIEKKEDAVAKKKLNKNYEKVKGGIVLRTDNSNIVLDAKNQSVVFNCLHFLNNALFIAFKSVNFVIDKLISFKRDAIHIGAGSVNLKALYADSISNKAAGKVSITGQDGLTTKHEESKVKDDKMTLKSLASEVESELAQKLINAELKFKNDEFNDFEYRYEGDELTVEYDKHYQTISEQLISSYNKNETFFTTNETWDTILAKAPRTGRPPYPPASYSKLGYVATYTTYKPCDDKKPKANQRDLTTTPSDYFHKPTEYNDNPFYTA